MKITSLPNKVQAHQKLGLRKTGKVSKTNSSKVKKISAEVKEVLKKNIPDVPKASKEKPIELTRVEKKSKKPAKEITQNNENYRNSVKNSPEGVIKNAKKQTKASTETPREKDKSRKPVKEFSADQKRNKSSKVLNDLKLKKIVEVKGQNGKQKKARNASVESDSVITSESEEEDKVLDSKPSIPDSTILKAIGAINKLDQTYQLKKNELFSDEAPLFIQIDSIKIAHCVKRKLRFKLPHTLVTDTSDICLFVCDLKRGKKVDHEPTLQHYEDFLREKGVTNIKTIIPVRQIRVEYDQIEMKRRLLTQFDFFLTDARVSGLLAHKLGSIFFKKNQLPTPIRMEAPNLKNEIDKALHKTVLRLHGEGTSFSLRVGNGKQTAQQVCENIQAVLLQVAAQFPGGWNNVRSVHIKSARSMAIPVYITLRNKNNVARPIVKPLHSGDDMVEGDLSTILGAKVQVYRSGKVVVKKDNASNEDSDDDDEPTSAKKTKLNKKQDSGDSKKKGAAKNKKATAPQEDSHDESAEQSQQDSEVQSDEELDEEDQEVSEDESVVDSEDESD